MSTSKKLSASIIWPVENQASLMLPVGFATCVAAETESRLSKQSQLIEL